MPFLSQISLPPLRGGGYTAQIPALGDGLQLRLKSNVTFFVGENGSGKSTLLEGIAERCGFSLNGGNRNHNLNTGYRFEGFESPLTEFLELSWTPRRINDGFFMRAENFFNFASYIDELALEDSRILEAYGVRSISSRMVNLSCRSSITSSNQEFISSMSLKRRYPLPGF